MADLAVDLAGVPLRNPLILASGIWGESGDSLSGAWDAGAGAVITKSIGSVARPGYPNPTVEPLDMGGMLNAMGLPNPGIDEYPVEIARARAHGVVLIGSVFGGTPEEFGDLAGRMAATGVAALELNLSCPHAEGYGTEIGSDPDDVAAVVRAVVREVRIPVFAKITPNAADLPALARAAEKAGAHGISAINTVRAMAIDPVLERPVLAHGLGGLSGPAIKAIGVAAVWQIAEAVRIPVVGVGGIRSATDVIEYLLAGATAVEIGTAVATDGIGIFGRIATDLARALDDRGVRRVGEIVGRARRGFAVPSAEAPAPGRGAISRPP